MFVEVEQEDQDERVAGSHERRSRRPCPERRDPRPRVEAYQPSCEVEKQAAPAATDLT